MSRLFLWLACVLALVACSPIERQDVPVHYGLRLNRTLYVDTLQKDLAAMRALNSPRLVVELLVEPDSNGLPVISPQSLQEWRMLREVLLQNNDIRVSVGFTHDQFHPLFLNWDHSKRTLWFEQYAQVLQQFIKQAAPLPLERVLVGNSFDRIAHYREEWTQLLQTLRPTTRAKLTYVSSAQKVAQFHAWAQCDEVAINYADTDTDNQKVLAQQVNPALAEVALQYQKPLFIANANLIGQDKLLKLKNRLRFYGNAELSGINLNNIFPQTALTDTSRYFFGLTKEAEVQAYLRKYTR